MNQTGAPPAADISQLAEHLFRHEAGKLVSVLTSIFGTERLQLAEDVVQEALLRALQTWPYYGVPKNPAAWLTQTAKNLALDVLRREKTFRGKEAAIVATIETEPAANELGSFDQEIKDERLRMMFVCCHPLIAQEAQVALALKTLCGFSSAEIARAFLSGEAAIEKRLVRARQKIREARIAFEIPPADELSRRLDAVLQTIYLLFNEGYKASSGEKLVRQELCEEAIRLATLLAGHPSGDHPKTQALLALMLLNAARFSTRVDEEGNILRLKEQDRSAWSQPMIARGMFHLSRAASGEEVSVYHLQAGIAACHCAAPDYHSTDWHQILSLYDRLIQLDDSSVIALNRAVAVAQVYGPAAALEALESIKDREPLDSYYLYYAVRAEFESALNNLKAAAGHLRTAMQLTELKSEHSFLSRRLQECEVARQRNG
jgi:RNA polymerase sigma factor (sigma-70 family)